MRLPLDPAQWGVVIAQQLNQQFPALEPYVQFVRIIENDEEGNAFGVVAMMNAFVPFVVRAFTLKPLDVLMRVEDGESRFSRLTEANATMAVGGLGLGKPVDKLPPGAQADVPLAMLPPYAGMFGAGRRRRPDVMGMTQPVKLASEKFGPDARSVMEGFLSKAADAGVAEFFVERHLEALTTLMEEVKSASFKHFSSAVVVDPSHRGTARVFAGGGVTEEMTLKAAAEFLTSIGESTPERTVALMQGRPVILDLRDEATKAAFGVAGDYEQFYPTPKELTNPQDITEPGWYQHANEQRTGKMRVFSTTYLDGKPCSYLLAALEDGHAFEPRFFAKAAPNASSEELHQFYKPSELKAGEVAFMVCEKTGEASVPFTIKGFTQLPGGCFTLVVSPALGFQSTETLRFGDNKRPYRLSQDEIAYPKIGYMIYKLQPKRLKLDVFPMNMPVGAGEAEPRKNTTRVKIYKGGGLYSVQEKGRATSEGMARGALLALLMNRYGFTPEHAMEHLRQVDIHVARPFDAVITEEPVRKEASLEAEPLALALALYGLAKSAASPPPRGEREDTDRPNSAGEEKDLNPQKSGPNRVEKAPRESGPGGPETQRSAPDEQAPAGQSPSGPPGPRGASPGNPNAAAGPVGAPGMPGASGDFGAGIGPEVPFFSEVADELTAMAMGLLGPDELAGMYASLTNQLEDVQDLAGRILLLVRMGKIPTITEQEGKRILDESDKFRANLVNAQMVGRNAAAV